MKTTFNFSGLEITMNATCKGAQRNVWSNDNMIHYKFVVSISVNGEIAYFTFYDSFVNWQKNITILDADALKGALDCFLSDAMCYENARNFQDFCADLGYDPFEDRAKAMKAFKGCETHFNNALRLFGDVDTICNVLNEINESY